MATIQNSPVSTSRAKKFRDMKIRKGFKRVQKWVLDIKCDDIKRQMKEDLANYKNTEETKAWNELSLEQMNNIKGWR